MDGTVGSQMNGTWPSQIGGTPSLVVTNERDVGADFLVRELGERGARVIRLNIERAPDRELTL